MRSVSERCSICLSSPASIWADLDSFCSWVCAAQRCTAVWTDELRDAWAELLGAIDCAQPATEAIVFLAEEYYESHGAGGSLHIALDDGNLGNGYVAYCKQFAIEHNDPRGAILAHLMLKLSEDDQYDVRDRLHGSR